MNSTIPESINGYLILPVFLPKQSFLKEPPIHYLYLRRHQDRLESETNSRTLFVVNVPISSTQQHFRALFSFYGARVESVKFCDEKEKSVLAETCDRELHKSGSSAHITFLDSEGLDVALSNIKKGRKSIKKWDEGLKVPSLGVERYRRLHILSRPSHTDLQQMVDNYMSSFNNQESSTAIALRKSRNFPDEDGFITVVRGAKMGAVRMEEAELAKEKAKGKGELKDFYRFQTREEKKNKSLEIRKRFEEDKKKVAEMKTRRRFKPY
ncbi:Ribosomal RNA-processing protein 7 [Neolecta irregularis DAH-3]|uniref:Ribosomal RNA-processing protein 7 n=1 Tax=Neolecta irregularis (strain DAH-3) TaxID=1198029 RepID=A0A1U7LNJ9_NEOID|nr:Ribosomal RNA-processing protein 7 [Neolecta irregularis DAH-3]|eukprot:OLL24101.1 Ribosomal RNA-processing protein 7 [Neolecta irregularis DAH-3]